MIKYSLKFKMVNMLACLFPHILNIANEFCIKINIKMFDFIVILYGYIGYMVTLVCAMIPNNNC